MPPAERADAARNRERILEAARTCEPAELRLNDIARQTGLGVGTVYRHFPTVQSLIEAVVVGDLGRYREFARRATTEPNPRRALELLVRAGLALQLQDGGLQTVLLAEATTPDVARVKHELLDAADSVIAAAHEAGVVAPGLTAARLIHLVCGVEHAIRLTDDDPAFYLDVLIAGLIPTAST